MVWGVKEPDGFGDYRPEVDHDYGLEMMQKYHASLSHVEKKEIGMEDRPLFSKLMKYYTFDKGQVPASLMPSECQTNKSYSKLAHLIILWGFLAVDEELKSIIEKLEPDVHQFWPIEILMPKGKIYPKQYYGMVIRNFRDSFVPEESEYLRYSQEVNHYWGGYGNKADTAKLAFSKAKIGNAQIWREHHIYSPGILISDELQSAIAEAGLRIFKHNKVKVI